MKKLNKPWGYEHILEQNMFYMMKLLMMNKGHRCSLQYHEEKHETVYVISGALRFTYGATIDDLQTIDLCQGDSFVIPSKLIHRMEAIVDCKYLECSTSHEDDVVRLNDDYERAGT